ncbi:SDR family NAD(P)-dependent oxidoreductase [Owenweeksia hongkongensis]|uniref:SDR family NAD(P)-dependent oxidoreductase n=1 Tax=Owenweeksia hongkongensis TaxID=253245 RepID=UPI003A93F774
MSYFHGKTIWVTGASSGIGEATAKALSSKGCQLILSARRASELERVKSECSNPDSIQILPLDLLNNKEAQQWVDTAWKTFGGVDILINNGGIGQFGSVIETSDEVERKVFETNYFGHVAITKAILPKMLEAKKGQILTISSIAGKFGQANLAAYSASKAAVNLYYESLKEELHKTPIKIQVVSPGFIKTNVTINSLKPDGSKMEKNSPAQENGMPTDVFAKKLLTVLTKDSFHSYIGNKELLAVPLHTFVPGLLYKMLRK